MQSENWKGLILSGVLGGVLVAGVGTLVSNGRSASAAAPAATPQSQVLVVNAPEVDLPGYTGPLYDANGRVVGLSTPRKSSAAGAPYHSGSNANTTVSVHPQGRSLGKSAAIVAGSAGAGAAIGALAGGGKGAEIGRAHV